MCRKLAVKLIQRIGLIFLRPRMASWRYRKGQNSSIVANLEAGERGTAAHTAAEALQQSEQHAAAAAALVEAEAEEDVEHAEQLEGGWAARSGILQTSAAFGKCYAAARRCLAHKGPVGASRRRGRGAADRAG